ncbi:hypothetical protein R3W88_022239 [Solanum pinnatisectum]|uniref:S-protein homolog n=1 Tax=Solanum pinnatisectum TaxID=50273 RepID=A0AAV9LU15_9SOLN|nr:hypothetical protein R3W88_022239 [Solanum pinnatisectum]
MAYYPYTNVQLLLLISFIINLMMMTNASSFEPNVTKSFEPKVTEIFVSNLPQNTVPLKVHCQSEDDDLGVRTLKVNEKFDFSFRLNFWGDTHFYCAFVWGLNNNAFDVFLKRKSPCRFKFPMKDIYCTWLVKDSGKYFARTRDPNPSPGDFRFVYPWL